MWESYFGFKKTPFGDSPGAKQLFASAGWLQVKTRLDFPIAHPGAGLLTGEVGAGKSTAARVFTSTLHTNLYKFLYVHFTNGSALDLLRQIAVALDLAPAHFRGDLVRRIADAIVRLNQCKKQHPILICDEAHLLPHAALEQLPLLMNFDMDSSRYLSLPLIAGHGEVSRCCGARCRCKCTRHCGSASACIITWRDLRARNSMPIWRSNSRPPGQRSRCLTILRGKDFIRPPREFRAK